MAAIHIFSLAFLLSICLAEPPVQSGGFGGYSYPTPTYKPPSTNYGAPAASFKPSPTYHTPSNSYTKPSNTYGPPSNSYNVPSHNYQAPSNNYIAPQPTYNPPSSNYISPSSHYNSPSNSYQPPTPTYSAPSNNYKAPSSNYIAPSNNFNQGYNQISNAITSPGSSYGLPSGSGSGYNSHSHDHHSGHDEYSEPKSYEFGYAVKDPYTGNDYGRKETSDGNTVQGEYRVQLPDGRTQIVTYHADWKTGFHADVRYEGEAKYPETSGYTEPKNQFGSYPSSNYGAPSAQGNYNQVASQYSPPSSQYQPQADFTGSTGFGTSGKYDSYSQGYGGNKPTATYGTPAFH